MSDTELNETLDLDLDDRRAEIVPALQKSSKKGKLLLFHIISAHFYFDKIVHAYYLYFPLKPMDQFWTYIIKCMHLISLYIVPGGNEEVLNAD